MDGDGQVGLVRFLDGFVLTATGGGLGFDAIFGGTLSALELVGVGLLFGKGRGEEGDFMADSGVTRVGILEFDCDRDRPGVKSKLADNRDGLTDPGLSSPSSVLQDDTGRGILDVDSDLGRGVNALFVDKEGDATTVSAASVTDFGAGLVVGFGVGVVGGVVRTGAFRRGAPSELTACEATVALPVWHKDLRCVVAWPAAVLLESTSCDEFSAIAPLHRALSGELLCGLGFGLRAGAGLIGFAVANMDKRALFLGGGGGLECSFRTLPPEMAIERVRDGVPPDAPVPEWLLCDTEA